MDARNSEISRTGVQQVWNAALSRYERARAALGTKPFYGLGALLVLLLAGALYWLLAGGTAATYVTQPVTRGTVARTVTATGSINPVLTITVGSYVSGVIQEIDCDFNTKVAKGQLCAKIDPRPYQTIVDEDQAAVTSARAQLLKDQANLDYERVNAARFANLLAQQAASNDSNDVAANARKQASAQVALDR